MKKPVSILVISLLLIFARYSASAQVQLTFSGTPVVSGTPGAINTTYTFNNVGTTGSTTIKGVIRITAISGSASLQNIDATSGGAANAWQPIINGGNTANGSCWGITFEISFYEQATNFPVTLSSFRSSGIDIDGDDNRLREYNEPYGLTSYTLETPSNLTVTPVANGFNFRSPQTQYSGISLTQTNVATTWYYNNTHAMLIKIGSCCVGGTCSATGTNRQSSINFYDAVAYNVGNTVLPVNFLSLSGQPVTSGTKLLWSVARESGLKEYHVEKSNAAATGFAKIGKVHADSVNAETKQYQFVDPQAEGTAYYRIKGVDIDGRSKYSSTIRVSATKTNHVKVYHTPGSSNVDVELSADQPGMIAVKIFDQNGRPVYQANKRIQSGVNSFSIDGSSLFAKGIYYVHINRNDGETYSSKFIK